MMVDWSGAGTVVIWPLGDSNTEGSGVTFPWEYLTAALIDDRRKPTGRHASAVRFVGHRGSGRYLHSGTSGITAQNLAAGIPGYTLDFTPTVAIIQAGINDLIAGATAATIKTRVEACRDAVLARYPSCLIVVGPLFPNGTVDVTATNTELSAITGVVYANGHLASWVIATHMQSGTNVHPNQTGHDLYATALNTALAANGM